MEPTQHNQRTDVVIVGGGFAGCHAAIALGRAGHNVTVIDVNQEIPALFRAEKVSGDQLSLLKGLGLFDNFSTASSPVLECTNILGKHIVDRKPIEEYGMLYPDMIRLLRNLLPSNVTLRIGQVSGIETSDDIQCVTLANGEIIEARLVVLATGYGESLRRKLGFERHQTHPLHTVCAGFTLTPPASGFRFPGMTAYGEHLGNGVDYITIFPLGDKMRTNLFLFCDIRDPRIVALRKNGLPALFDILPGLKPWLEGSEITGDVTVFPVELYQYRNVARDGIVLIGDAYMTSCPSVGSGLSCSLTDVTCLRNHVTGWLATPGMSAEKIRSFYSDPLKLKRDKKAQTQAIRRRGAITGSSRVDQLRLIVHFTLRALRYRLYRFLSGGFKQNNDFVLHGLFRWNRLPKLQKRS